MTTAKQIELTCDQIVVVTGRNPRLALSGIEDLAASIKENGLIRPISVEAKGDGKSKTYELIDGHRRLAACQHLLATEELKIKIPALLATGLETEADVLVQMLTANDSVLFEPIEEAMMYQRMQTEFGLKNEDIAKRIGKSAAFVADRLALLRAHPVLQESVKDGSISTSDATTIIRRSRGDTAQQGELAERVLTEGREQVIDKELKRGRMPKPAWESATTTYDQIWQAAVSLKLEDGNTFLPIVLSAEDPIAKLAELAPRVDNPLLLTEIIYFIGKLSAFSDLSNLPMAELWNKVAERANY